MAKDLYDNPDGQLDELMGRSLSVQDVANVLALGAILTRPGNPIIHTRTGADQGGDALRDSNAVVTLENGQSFRVWIEEID